MVSRLGRAKNMSKVLFPSDKKNLPIITNFLTGEILDFASRPYEKKTQKHVNINLKNLKRRLLSCRSHHTEGSHLISSELNWAESGGLSSSVEMRRHERCERCLMLSVRRVIRQALRQRDGSTHSVTDLTYSLPFEKTRSLLSNCL